MVWEMGHILLHPGDIQVSVVEIVDHIHLIVDEQVDDDMKVEEEEEDLFDIEMEEEIDNQEEEDHDNEIDPFELIPSDGTYLLLVEEDERLK